LATVVTPMPTARASRTVRIGFERTIDYLLVGRHGRPEWC
jgi:hypothetical protein